MEKDWGQTMPSKFQLSSFSKPARRALERAQSLAARLKHQHVESEHVLLAVLEEDDSPGKRLLADLGVDTKGLGLRLIDELELMPKTYKRSDQVFVGKKLLASLQEALGIFEGAGNLSGVGTILSRLCGVLKDAGRDPAAQACAQRCRDVAEQTKND